LNAVQLKAFIHDRGRAAALTARHAWRVLTLVDAVLDHSARQQQLPRNTAAHDLLMSTPHWRFANAADKTPLPEHLPAHEARRLVGWLLDLPGAEDLHGAPPQAWQTLRNRTAVALQLGAGLTPGDVRMAATAGVVFEGGRAQGLPSKIRLPGCGKSPAREAPLAPWAARLLHAWLDTRSALQFAGPVLFPATRSGRPWGKVAQYGAAKAVLAAAGLTDVEGGSFRLRHTFALRQLRRGSAPADVARWMGLSDVAALARYRQVLVATPDLV
jgi:integrase